MKIEKILSFRFKENRTYVHGTDIFNETLKFIEGEGISFSTISMSINKITTKNLTCILTDEELEMKDFDVRFDIRDDGKSYHCLLKENDNAISDRYRYPENEIIAQAKITNEYNSIELLSSNIYTNIENIVALNKGLLENLFPDAKGKWYFVKLEVNNSFFGNYNQLQLKLVKNMHFRLTKTVILFDQAKVGSIYFSLKK